MCPLPADQLLMEHDILLSPAIPYIDFDELIVSHGKDESFTSFAYPDIPEVMSMPASSNNESPSVVSLSTSASSDHEANHERTQDRLKPTRQTRHPLKNISAAEHKRNKDKWSDTETYALISAVDKYGFKWTNIKHDTRFKNVLIKRSNVDLKDKWRNIITRDFRENFSISALNNIRGPTKWLKLTPLVAQAIEKYSYSIGDWKRLSNHKKFIELKKLKLGEVEILTIYRSYVNNLK